MAEISRRRVGELIRPLFELLMPLPDGMQARDALAALEKKVKLTATCWHLNGQQMLRVTT